MIRSEMLLPKMPSSLEQFLARHGWGEIQNSNPIGGGCINDATRIETEHGPPALLKTNARAPQDIFAREAAGLQSLRAAGGPRVPQVYGFDRDWILLEFIASSAPAPDYAQQLGAQLARLHDTVSDTFGFAHDNYLGSTPQPNPRCADGHAFFGEHRLQYQGKLARAGGLLARDELAQLERVINRLPDLVPAQPASLIHGDLWSGNILVGPHGEPVLIDPAAHYGWAEADLAMTALFGRLPESAYESYAETRPLTPGWRERFDIYNLYHLLNHLNLFGASYHGQVMALIQRYG